MSLDAAVRERDDDIAGCEGEEFVGEGGADLYERSAGFADALGEDLSVLGELCGRADAAPHDAVARGEHRDCGFELLRGHVLGECVEVSQVAANRGREEFIGGDVVECAPEAFAG